MERGLTPALIFTDQQELHAEEFWLERHPAIHLNCPGRPHPHAHARDVRATLKRHVGDADLVVVQGDTSSALGAAQAASDAGVPIAHVEAGLRSHDSLHPWPEERYRRVIDARADLLFAPTTGAAQNLRDEGAPGEVFVTGNTGIDALLSVACHLPAPIAGNAGPPQILVTCHRRESWRCGLRFIAAALTEIASDGTQVILVLHPTPRVAMTMRDLLSHVANIELIDPCPHAQLIGLMRDADLILSDSGGIQEEAPALGTPLLVLREKTERPEGIVAGNMRLVGTSTERIIAEARRLLEDPAALAAMSRRSFPYGDGGAAPRIAAIIEQWRNSRTLLSAGRNLGDEESNRRGR